MQNFRVDLHNGGPIIYNSRIEKYALNLKEQGCSINNLVQKVNKYRVELLCSNLYPEYTTTWKMSKVDVAVRTVGIFSDIPFSLNQILADADLVHQLAAKVEWIYVVKNYNDILLCKEKGKKGYLLMVESLEDVINYEEGIDTLYHAGVRIVQPVYNYGNIIGNGCFDSVDYGLTEKGRTIVSLLRNHNMILDYSHVGEKTALDIMEYASERNIVTHSLSALYSDSKRAKGDTFFRELKNVGGFAALTVNPNFYCKDGENIEKQFIIQLEHLLVIMGEDNVGIGTDWDGPMPSFLSENFEKEADRLKNSGYSLKINNAFYNGMFDWPHIAQVIEHNFGKNFANKICGNNALAFFQRNL